MAEMSITSETDLPSLRRRYVALVETEAEQARYVSPAQEAIYQQKLAEAQGLEGATPLLDAEATAVGMSREELAEAVRTARRHWQEKAGRVEVARRQAKVALGSARSAEQAYQILREFRARVA